mgnify:CR=1 FL=1|jgi:hypothetical protein
MEARKPEGDAANDNAVEEVEENEIFVPYVPSIPIRNARPHPAYITESASLK